MSYKCIKAHPPVAPTLLAFWLAFFFVCTALCACSSDGHGKKDAHSHDDNLLLTGYSDNLEVFAEATPMVVGEKCDIFAHFTNLKDFKPVPEGTAQVQLSVAGKEVSQTLTQPEHPGIYKFQLIPPAPGTATLTFSITSKGEVIKVVITGIKVYSDHHKAYHEASEMAPHSGNAVAFTKEMSWKVDFATSPVTERPLGQIIRTMALVEPSQADSRAIVAKSAGIVTFIMPDLIEGKSVAAGQPLFRINSDGLADNNLKIRLLEAKSNYDFAKREYTRIQELFKDRLVTESDLLSAKRDLETALAAYESLAGGFSGGSSSISSPISGYITDLYVINGAYVETGATLAQVSQNRDLYLKADIPAKYAPYLGEIHSVYLDYSPNPDAYSVQDQACQVVSMGKSADPSTSLIPATFKALRTSYLVPGTYVEMYINAGPETPVIAVPNSALVEEMGNFFVYMQLTPEYFEKCEVKTGRTDGSYTEILSGIKPGQRVVSRGAVLVKLAHSSGTLDPHAGHVH